MLVSFPQHTGDSSAHQGTLAYRNFEKTRDALSVDLRCSEIKANYAEQVGIDLDRRRAFARPDARSHPFLSLSPHQAVNLVKSQIGVMAKDTQLLLSRFRCDEERQKEAHDLEVLTLKRKLAGAEVEHLHEKMVSTTLNIQLEDARDSLKNVRVINESLKRFLSVEKKLGRDLLAENGTLRSELASYEGTFGRQAAMLEERQKTIDGLEETRMGLEAALREKGAELTAAVEGAQAAARAQAAALEKQFQESLQQSQSLQQQKPGMSVESLVKKGGFESEKELVQFVKSRAAQDKHIERLERRVQDILDEKNEEILLRKEIEKIVRQQKKEIVALEKRLAKEGGRAGKKRRERAGDGVAEKAEHDGVAEKAEHDGVAEKAEATATGGHKAPARKTVKKSIEVDVDGKDDASVWNPDSARHTRDSQEETADRVTVDAEFSAHNDADKENPKVALNVSKASVAKGPATATASAATAATTTNSKKRNLLTVQRASTTSTSMLGVTRKMGSSFSLPRLNQPK